MTPPLLALVSSEVPVTPGADRARSWIEQELLDPVYHTHRSLLQTFLDWLRQLFHGATTLGVPSQVAAVVTAVVLVLVAAIGFWVAGPVRRARRARTPGAVHAGDDRRSADDLRGDAQAAAARGRWALAVAERFRAIVRDLEQRAVIDERPGRTADEAVEAAAERLGALATELRRAGRLFDDVVYGDGPADADDDAWLRALDERVARTRASAGVLAVTSTAGLA
jgi:hypothetical protein